MNKIEALEIILDEQSEHISCPSGACDECSWDSTIVNPLWIEANLLLDTMDPLEAFKILTAWRFARINNKHKDLPLAVLVKFIRKHSIRDAYNNYATSLLMINDLDDDAFVLNMVSYDSRWFESAIKHALEAEQVCDD